MSQPSRIRDETDADEDCELWMVFYVEDGFASHWKGIDWKALDAISSLALLQTVTLEFCFTSESGEEEASVIDIVEGLRLKEQLASLYKRNGLNVHVTTQWPEQVLWTLS